MLEKAHVLGDSYGVQGEAQRGSKLSRFSANHHRHADETQLSTLFVIVTNTKNTVPPSLSSITCAFAIITILSNIY